METIDREIRERLTIRNFGPLSFADLEFEKVTVFIGRQGSGKSTLAKLYSLFCWLEKSLMRHTLTAKHVSQYARFRKTYCAYNNLSDYFRSDTYLCFQGMHFNFEYTSGSLKISEREDFDDTFKVSKVVYVPAERNILGCVDHPSRLRGLPAALSSFGDEFATAKVKTKNSYRFPFEDVGFVYDSLNDMPKLRLNNDFEIKLSEAASGFQSSLPLLLVVRNLARMVSDSSQNGELTATERHSLQKEVENILGNKLLSDDVKEASLRTLSARFRYSRLVAVVEEPELNLYPDSQKGVLYELLHNMGFSDSNRLVLTTHSPYLMAYLTLAVKAFELWEKASAAPSVREMLKGIVAEGSMLPSSHLKVYEVEDGNAKSLDFCEGLPSDDNFLNNKLAETDANFIQLLEIEDSLSR